MLKRHSILQNFSIRIVSVNKSLQRNQSKAKQIFYYLKVTEGIQVHLLVSYSVISIVGLYYGYEYLQKLSVSTYQVFINPNKIIFKTEEKFLSVALDSSFMGCTFHQLNEGDWEKFKKLSKLLSPAYLRLGGTAADQTVFDVSGNFVKNNSCLNILPNQTIIITGDDWKKINQFARDSGFSFIIDLNVLLRSKLDWDSSNAKSLIDFSDQNGFRLDFQLGNEPNSFPHVFNVSVPATQLARDFFTLRSILKSTKTYQKSLLIGPDVTKPHNKSLLYLKKFLNKAVVDVASWHQYYLNGRIATLHDFIDPKTFDVLQPQIQSVVKTVREFSAVKPIWLSETSSAYGGGAPGLSNRFAASFLWLDKLGLAAKSGISVVIRQTLFENNYALITDKFKPTPDFWISLLYKKLVGNRVLDLHGSGRSEYLRLYAHCLVSDSGVNGNIVMYGLNLKNQTELIDLENPIIKTPVHAYIFEAPLNDLKSSSILLNNNLLIYNEAEVPDLVKTAKKVELPLIFHPFTIGFWVFKAEDTACNPFRI